jgi:hypothetical protein
VDAVQPLHTEALTTFGTVMFDHAANARQHSGVRG